MQIQAHEDWAATAQPNSYEVQVGYRCPRCTTRLLINVQLPTDTEPVETELWCHRCQVGAPATITA